MVKVTHQFIHHAKPATEMPAHFFAKFCFAWLLLAALSSCKSSSTAADMNNNQSNPLLCNPDSGICEIPSANSPAQSASAAKEKAIKLIYFTDPICSSCWGIEPQLRKLKLEYGDDIEIEYHMGGLLPSWNGFNGGGITKPSDVAVHWDEVSAHYQMPIDGDVWLEDPLNSSFPPSVAFYAAAMQDSNKAVLFLRRIREMVFTEKKNITRWEHLQAAAFACGLDTARMRNDFEQNAGNAFQVDLAYARNLGVRGFPTIIAVNNKGAQEIIYGFRSYAQFEQAIHKLYPQAVKYSYSTSADSLFAHYSTLTAKEYAVLASVTYEQAITQLDALTAKGELTKHTCKNGSIWRKR
jgi:putative protein-disulfide isomerase